ncbi:MAG: cytochrome c oxidase assembly protein, partial [Thermoleophilaceae bacterium]
MSPPLAHVGGGTLEPLQLAVPIAAGVAYVVRSRTLDRQGRPVPVARRVSFALGLVLVLASLVSPVAHLGEELLLAHMAQHLAMADVGALLIVIGLTGPILQPVLAIRAIDRLRALAHPAVALPLWAVNLYVWHLPVLYQGALASEWLHVLQHATFVAFGINMWMSLLGPLPMPEWFGNGAKLAYVVSVRLAGALLANVLMWSEAVLYPDYAPGEAIWGIAPLSDQATAGVIMMVEGSILTIVLFGWLFMKTAGEGEERQRLLELASRNGLELSERRAARAVGAGRGADLRRRLERAAAAGGSDRQDAAATGSGPS